MGAPCVGPSSKWSCIRHVSAEAVAKRKPAKFGFTAEEAKGTPFAAYTQKQWVDASLQLALGRSPDGQVKHMPNTTEYHKGYLKMRMPVELFEKLHAWQNEYSESHRAVVREQDTQMVTNSHAIDMYKLDLDQFPDVKKYVIKEMKEVLQWWARARLKHTSTYGMRIYRRGSVLATHMDRMETHLVSAILQVNQTTDKNGGWPLDVYHPHQLGVKEVYLQPGEMLLYEGARLVHGRPMRFKGESFSNIFTHFIPPSWRGINEDWRNPHFRKEEL